MGENNINRLTILQNDLTILRSELKRYENGKSAFKSREQIIDMIDFKKSMIKKLTHTNKKKK